ncbi:MAG: RICIN domain-containing protein [Lachnospiraceae bacterium]|nr:RICIN domain-containing protein [Lachnospiraceae bacterium]
MLQKRVFRKSLKRVACCVMGIAVMAASLTIGGNVSTMQTVEAASTTTVEYLNRGVSAFSTGSGMLVSWRYLASDSTSTVFKLYRDNSLIYTSNAGDATCYLDTAGSSSSSYKVETVVNGSVISTDSPVIQSGSSYKQLNLSRPGSSYMPNDCSVGDVDGDGTYEIFLKWDPSNSKDNSQSGKTSNVYIDCYKLDGTRLWRIDLGKNIRAGAHYTQFLVADFDGDGKAEMTCKTADGTVDGQGNVIGDASKDYRNSKGYVLSGPEYYSLFDGATGKVLDTVDYEPARGTVSKWGDSYGNRCDRFLGAVCYFDSNKPSAVTVRGYYTRMTACAYDVVNDKLVKRWYFDSNDSGNSAAKGNGNHNCMPADVDGDGKQELILGATCLDDNGKILWCSKLGHGDAMHLGDFLPNRSGLELWVCHEVSPYGTTLLDAKTGKQIFRKTASSDTGRCCADNIWAGNDGAEFWGNGYDILNGSGSTIMSNRPSINFVTYWDGDLERELLDGNKIMKYQGSSGSKTLVQDSSCTSCNSTKATPCLSADIFGDWREEVIWPTSDGTAIRIYATTYDTDYRITTLMHDPQYRNQVAGQNIAYNQPPHASFYLGSDKSLPSKPNVTVRGGSSSSGSSSTTNAPLAASALVDGGYYMIQNVNSGLYMEVANGSAEKGANVQQWGADGAAQHNVWRAEYAGNGYYKLYSQVGDGNTYLLDVTGAKSANGTNIEIYTDSGSSAQLFKFVKNGDGSYRIYTKASNDGSCVEVTNALTSSGANVQQWAANGHNCQNWKLTQVDFKVEVEEETPTVESTIKQGAELVNGALYMIKNANSGLYMEVANGSAENGANVQQWGADGAANHNTWRAESAGNGYYKLYSQVGDGKTYLLDVTGAKADDGTNIEIYTDSGSDAQLFKFVKNSDGSYKIYTKTSNDASCVEIVNALTSSGANVQQWSDNGHACQNWILTQVVLEEEEEESTQPEVESTIKPASALEDGAIYMIKNANSGLYMEVTGGSAANGTNVQQWGADGAASHNTWRVEYAGDGYYKLYSQVGDGNTYLLDIANGAATNGTNIQIYSDTNCDAQLFKFTKNSDGSYKIYTKVSQDTSCVEIVNALTSSGANVQEWEDNGHACQNWYLTKVEAEKEEEPSVEESSEAESSESSSSGSTASTIMSNKLVHTYTAQTEYVLNLNDYISDLTVGDDVRITAKFAGNTYYGGGLGAMSNENGSATWICSNYSNDDSCNASATLDMTAVYDGTNNIYIQMWWFGSGSVDLYLTIEKLN